MSTNNQYEVWWSKGQGSQRGPTFAHLEQALKYVSDHAGEASYAIRQPDGFDFEITVQQPITHSDPETMTQDVNDGLEALVRQHMDQWFWIHRRWKPYIVPDQTDV